MDSTKENKGGEKIKNREDLDLPLPMSYFEDIVCVSGGEYKFLDFFNWKTNSSFHEQSDRDEKGPVFQVKIEESDIVRIYGVSFVPPEYVIFTTNSNNGHKFYSLHLPTLKIKENFGYHKDPCWRVNYIPEISSPGHQIIASSSGDKTIGIWNIDGTLLHKLKAVPEKKESGHNQYIRETIFFSPTNRFYSCGEGHCLYSWNLKDYKKEGGSLIYDTISEGLYSLDKSEEKGLLLSGSNQSKIYILSPREKTGSNLVKQVEIPSNKSVWDLIVNEEKNLFVASSFSGGSIHMFDFRKLDQCLFSEKVHDSTVYRLTKLDAEHFASGCNSGEVKVFPYNDINLKKHINLKKRKDGYVYGLCSCRQSRKGKDSLECIRDRLERVSFLSDLERQEEVGILCALLKLENVHMIVPKLFLYINIL